MRSQLVRSHGLRLLNKMPRLKMQVRGLYFSLLAVQPSGSFNATVAQVNPTALACTQSATAAQLPDLPATPASPFASPLETCSRQPGKLGLL